MPSSNRFQGKKTSKASQGESGNRLCFVLCNHARPPGLSNATSVVSDVFGAGYSANFEEESVVSVMHGDETIGFLGHMPAPIPNGEAEHFADGNILWPEGRKEAAAHRSHVVVINRGAADQSPVESAITLSRLALVGLRLFDGTGVYWGNGFICNSRAVFEDFCQEMSEDRLPVPLWLRFQLFAPSDDRFGMRTLGMHQFDLMDIEVDQCSMDIGDLFEFVADTAHYLIQNGPVFDDGDTISREGGERMLVRHAPSMIDEDEQVYKIVLED